MLKLLSSTSRQIQTHLTPPCLRFTTESHPSSFLKLLCSLTGLIHGNHKSLSFYRRAFFCSGSYSGDGGDGGGFVEVEVRSGASEIGAEGGAADASYSSAIVPSNPRPEDYLMVYKRLKLALLLVKKEMETSKIQGRFLQGTIFPINKQDPNTLLLQLLNSGADPELTLRYFTWSQKEFKLSHSLELTFRILNSLALAKKYSKIRSFLHKFVKYEKDYSVSAIFHAISMSGDSFCVNSILADMLGKLEDANGLLNEMLEREGSDQTNQESQRRVAREGNLRAALNEKGRIKDFCSKGKLEGANGFSMRYWIWVWCQIEQLLNR
ncbi:hypothetical protein OIU74_021316 [Salix koriyanagi]|uniref:Pentatricopeptide repeat-containing protein n=1 Tax=Salix koriyanagi TaxID=2511006 RepID=A0A9Q0P830_9ROSI|nr:hypothetical protein OIU74_021316 [Salix koriyanagi]